MNNFEHYKCNRKNEKHFAKMLISAISLMLILCFGIGGTLAFLATKTNSIKNTFTAAVVKEEIDESFDGTQKTSITVKNTGDTEVYVRVKLISYRVDAEDKKTVIAGDAAIDESFELGDNWIKYEGCYYYKYPLDVLGDGNVTSNLLKTPITLKDYTEIEGDDIGGIQVIEVLSEAIQALPKTAVIEAWGRGIASQLTDAATTTEITIN